MKFTSSILLLVLPALSLARPPPQTVDGPIASLRVRGDEDSTSVRDAILGLRFVGDVGTLTGGPGDIQTASTGGEPREYPLLAGPSMNITLVVTDIPDSLEADGEGYPDKNGTVTRLAKRRGNLQCVRVCMNGDCDLVNCRVA
ncbi:hypothetical protein C7212DRAFT_363844 [Tuber magnatum]|uniref:Uncharacterized protein n=1 Tax=Tuber magnatum TaxID=42249 RepID=A0A317SQQ0_9PEZI|nr:hypothetical protein C7212DRAFT_363844 [Tuber magnatum]